MTGSKHRAGFTLIELLAVVAIIALLIGILTPAVSSARAQARKVASLARIDSIGKGCQMFQTETDRYPKSGGPNPFETGAFAPGTSLALLGAQWVALQLTGADQQGWVKDERSNDANRDGIINEMDWRAWYDVDTGPNYSRVGPFVTLGEKVLRSPRQLVLQDRVSSSAGTPSYMLGSEDGGTGGSSNFNNGRVPMFIDAFGFPILYYAANPSAKSAFTFGSPTGGGYTPGIYDHSHNGGITGQDGRAGEIAPGTAVPGWDFSKTGRLYGAVYHPLGNLGVANATERRWPTEVDEANRGSFADQVLDSTTFENTRRSDGRGVYTPKHADSYLLISPGRDGIYGTADDVKNF